MDAPFMEFFAQGLAAGGLRVVRFEFPYMAQRRLGGPKRPQTARMFCVRPGWMSSASFEGRGW